MKNCALFLLIANIVVAAWFIWLHSPSASSALPLVTGGLQVISEQEWQAGQVLPASVASAPVAAAVMEASVPLIASSSAVTPQIAPTSASVVEPMPVWCAQSKPLPSQSAAKLRTALQMYLEKRQVQEKAQASKTRFWVFVPPHVSLQAAQLNLALMQTKGVQDAFIMRDQDKWQYAISLGLFSTQAAAETLKESLQEKGVSAVSVKAQELSVFKLTGLSEEDKQHLVGMNFEFKVCGAI